MIFLVYFCINRYANELIEVYNDVIVFQVLVSIITICLMAFQTVVVRIKNFLKFQCNFQGKIRGVRNLVIMVNLIYEKN